MMFQQYLDSTFQESDLFFRFASNWQVRAFDKHTYYKIFSGQGFKGVDFVGILNNKTPCLIEVKNFKHRQHSPKAPDIQVLLGEHPQLIEDFIEKIEDTLHAIRLIRKLLERKWEYRFAMRCNHILGKAFFGKKDWLFWTQLYNCIHQKEQALHFVLWLRTEAQYPQFTQQQILALKSNLRQSIESHFSSRSIKFYIADIYHNPYAANLQVVEVSSS